MAAIQKRRGKNGSNKFKVVVRIKGEKTLCATFNDETTAMLWGKYKENIIHEMKEFSVPRASLYTVRDLFCLKFGDNSREYSESREYFLSWIDTPISEISYDDMIEKAHELLKKTVLRGGNKKTKSGKRKLPQVITILRKFAYLSSAINYLISKGVDSDNFAIKIVAYLKTFNENPYL